MIFAIIFYQFFQKLKILVSIQNKLNFKHIGKSLKKKSQKVRELWGKYTFLFILYGFYFINLTPFWNLDFSSTIYFFSTIFWVMNKWDLEIKNMCLFYFNLVYIQKYEEKKNHDRGGAKIENHDSGGKKNTKRKNFAFFFLLVLILITPFYYFLFLDTRIHYRHGSVLVQRL